MLHNINYCHGATAATAAANAAKSRRLPHIAAAVAARVAVLLLLLLPPLPPRSVQNAVCRLAWQNRAALGRALTDAVEHALVLGCHSRRSQRALQPARGAWGQQGHSQERWV